VVGCAVVGDRRALLHQIRARTAVLERASFEREFYGGENNDDGLDRG
jgi:hypothetical protein